MPTWSVCNEMYHNVFRYEYLTFQTQIHLHKQYIFVTNIIQSEYAFLFPFSIYGKYSYFAVKSFPYNKFWPAFVNVVISYLNGINHETVSKQLFYFYFLYIPLHTTQSSYSIGA